MECRAGGEREGCGMGYVCGSDEGASLEDLNVFLVGDVEELGDVVDVSLGHGLAVVLLDEVASIRGMLLVVWMCCSV